MQNDLDRFVRKYAPSGNPSLDTMIHPDDEMYTFPANGLGHNRAWMMYFQLGSELTRTILQIANWRFAGRLEEIKFLEFACGYGRNVRHLLHLFPRDHIFVSDIQEKAVQFNIDQFGVAGRASVHRPEDLRWDERFDLIVVPSLFSHLPEETFAGWIAALHGLLTSKGILVFSVHGSHLMGPDVTVPESGIHFVAESENSVLDKEEYGLSYVTESFVKKQISEAIGHTTYSMTKRGFWNHQDFYILSKSEPSDLGSFRYDYGVLGHLDRVSVSSKGTLELSGWAKDARHPRAPRPRVEVLLDGRRIGRSRRSHERSDVAKAIGEDFLDTGFLIKNVLPSGRFDPSSSLVVELVAGRQRECIHALGLADSVQAGERSTLDRLASTPGASRWRRLRDVLIGA
jgi:SAM-dependent methyltransferase